MKSNRTLIVLAAVAVVAVLAATVAGTLVFATTHSSAVSNCEQIELLKGHIRDSITNSTATLGRPGSAGFHYYKTHPDELVAAKKEAAAQLVAFAPKDCP